MDCSGYNEMHIEADPSISRCQLLIWRGNMEPVASFRALATWANRAGAENCSEIAITASLLMGEPSLQARGSLAADTISQRR